MYNLYCDYQSISKYTALNGKQVFILSSFEFLSQKLQ